MGDSLGICGYDEKNKRIFDFDLVLGIFSVVTVLSILLVLIDSETKKVLIPYYTDKNVSLFLIYCGVSFFSCGVFGIRADIIDARGYFGWTGMQIFLTIIRSIFLFGFAILFIYGGIYGLLHL